MNSNKGQEASKIDELIARIEIGDYEYALRDDNGKKWGCQEYSALTEESVLRFKRDLAYFISQAFTVEQNKLDLTKLLSRDDLIKVDQAVLKRLGLAEGEL